MAAASVTVGSSTRKWRTPAAARPAPGRGPGALGEPDPARPRAEPQRARRRARPRSANGRPRGAAAGRNGCVTGPPSSWTTPASPSGRSTGDPPWPQRDSSTALRRRGGRGELVGRARRCTGRRQRPAHGSAAASGPSPGRACSLEAVGVVERRGQHRGDAEGEEVRRPSAASGSQLGHAAGGSSPTQAWCSHSSPERPAAVPLRARAGGSAGRGTVRPARRPRAAAAVGGHGTDLGTVVVRRRGRPPERRGAGVGRRRCAHRHPVRLP